MGSIPQGIHNAVCIGVIDMGTQKSIYSSNRKIALLWEIYINSQEKTFSREYTFSFHKDAMLRLHLESWRGRPFTDTELADFNIKNIIGVPCKIEIRKNSKGLKQVQNVSRLPKNESIPIPKGKCIFFDMNDKKTYSALEFIPPYLMKRIKETPEYKLSVLT